MATTSQTVPLPSQEESVYIAPQWKLVWWRFKRHRLAMGGSVVVIAFYLVAALSGFLSIHDPNDFSSKRIYMPPQAVHFFDGWSFQPFVYYISGVLDRETYQMEYTEDKSIKYPIRVFAHGYEYKFWGLFTTDIHLLGVGKEAGGNGFYPLGADKVGRDMLSRLVHGTRMSLSVGLIGVTISLFMGVLLGGLSGYFGGVVDLLIQRLIEFLRSIPTLPLWLALSASVPPGWSPIKTYFAITIIISIIGWTGLAREVRGRFLSLRQEDFVIAARAYGTRPLRIIFRHMLPSFMSHIIAVTTLAVPAMILAETALSFLGLGLRPPIMSWGVLLKDAQNVQSVANAVWVLSPAPLVLISVLALNFTGDGLRDAADPYSTHG
jgi:peptide/nickel transport system permease protein